jgi:signal transduction histidine kinase
VNGVVAIHPDSEEELRLPGEYVHDEIGALANAFRDLLERINSSIQREKEFTQDVSHELRTPLMALSSSLDIIETKITDTRIQEKI